MTARGAFASRPLADVASGGVLVAAGAACGALFAVSAFAIHPLAFPALLALGTLAAVTVARPEVGIAAAFLFVPLGNFGLTGRPPWLLLAAWSAFLFAIGLARVRPGGGPLGSGTTRIGGVAALYLLVTAVAAGTVTAALGDAFPVVRSIATGVLLLGAIATVVRTREQAMWVLGGIAASVLVVGGYATWEYLSGAEGTAAFFTASGSLVTRVNGGFGQPNQLAGYLVMLIPFAVAGAVLGRRSKAFFAAAVVLGAIGVYASFSRGALIGLVLVPLVFVRGRRMVPVAVVLALAILVATPNLLQERFTTLGESGAEVASRVDIWETAGSIWAANPLLGVGAGGFPGAYAGAPVADKQFLPDTRFEPPPHAHNIELHVLAEGGIVGLVLLLAVVAAAIRASVRARRDGTRWISVCGSAGLAALAAFLVHNQFDVTLLEGTGSYFWAVLGLVAALAASAALAREPSGSARG